MTAVRLKNECAKLRSVDDPYEIWQSLDGRWTWKVLKKYQINDDKEYARWLVHVISPICPNGEQGDEYVATIKSQAKRIK